MKVAKRTFFRVDRNGKMSKCSNGPQLSYLLDYWGVRKSLKDGNRTDAKSFCELNQWELSDLYDLAKSVFRSRIAAAHTDLGGNHDLATSLNVVWDTTERLFRKHGVEI